MNELSKSALLMQDEKLRALVDQLETMSLVQSLWWFIENMADNDLNRTAVFFYLRERVRGSKK